MMDNYVRKGSVIEATLEDGKVVKMSSKFIDNMMTNLEIDEEDAVMTWLEDEGYLENDEQEELDEKARANKSNKIVKAKAEVAKKKTQKERVRKENPVKESIIKQLAEFLVAANYENVVVENVGKIITFKVDDREFKIDLIEKRKAKKAE